MVRSSALQELLATAMIGATAEHDQMKSSTSASTAPCRRAQEDQTFFNRNQPKSTPVVSEADAENESSPLPTPPSLFHKQTRPTTITAPVPAAMMGFNSHNTSTAVALFPLSERHDGTTTPNGTASAVSSSTCPSSQLRLGGVAMNVRPCALCQELVEHSSFIDHLDRCPANIQSCLHCFSAVMVSQLDEHVMQCPKNARCCYICGRPVQLSSLAQHLQSCSVGKSLKMFHGTSLANAKSIMKSGFRPSVKGLLGEGVYLTKDVQKAQAYGPIIIESEVCLGRVCVINKKGHHLQRCWAAHGYDSAWIPPQCGVVASGLEEHCVRDARRIAPLRFFSSLDEGSAGHS